MRFFFRFSGFQAMMRIRERKAARLARRRAKEKALSKQRNETASKPLKAKEAAKASVSRAELFQGLSGLGRNHSFRAAKNCASFSAQNVTQGAPEQIAAIGRKRGGVGRSKHPESISRPAISRRGKRHERF
jgi:hypothetical protein